MEAKAQSVESPPSRGADGTPSTSPLRASARRKTARSSSNMVLGSVLVMVLLGAFALVLPHLGPKEAVTDMGQSRGERDGRVGTVTLSREGDHCRRMALDNSTGKMVEVDRVRCAGEGPASPEDAVRERYSGGRIDAIRKSFSGR